VRGDGLMRGELWDCCCCLPKRWYCQWLLATPSDSNRFLATPSDSCGFLAIPSDS